MKTDSIKLRTVVLGLFFVAAGLLYSAFLIKLNFANVHPGYRITAWMPPLFAVCYLLFLHKPLIQYKSPFIFLFTLVCVMRYVVLSVLTLRQGDFSFYSRISPADEHLRLAGLMMCFELVVDCAVIRLLSDKLLPSAPRETRLKSADNVSVYLLFIAFVLLLLLAVPKAREGLSFGFDISHSENESVGPLLILGIRECFVNAKYFLLFAAVWLLQKDADRHSSLEKRESDLPLRGYWIILLFCVIVVALRIGTNKKKLICDALACMFLLMHLFPKRKTFTIGSLSVLAFLFVLSAAIFRGQNNSAVDLLSQFFTDIQETEQYFCGQYHVAIAIEAKLNYPEMISWQNCVLHFFRPMFIIGSFVKKIPGFILLSDVFDRRMSYAISGAYGSIDSQILCSLGEGYMMFGKLFSPIFSAAVSALGLFFDRLFKRSDRMEIVFISIIMAFYCAQGMILGTTQIINHLTYRLTIYLAVVWLNSKFQIKV